MNATFFFQENFSDDKSVPLIIFGAVTFVGGVLTFILPETRGVKLPDTIQDAETFNTKQMTYSAGTSNDIPPDSRTSESTKM